MLLVMTTKGKHNKWLIMQPDYAWFDEFDDQCKHILMMTPKWNITQVSYTNIIQTSFYEIEVPDKS